MSRPTSHAHGHGHSRRPELHTTWRSAWLRAAVLGANDGIVSTASLVIGVAAADVGRSTVLTAGIASLVAGAMSMAAGEYVSVSSQRDAEAADLEREADELARFPEAELAELTQIYVERGLDRPLAREVAEQLTQDDALAAHARDELGLTAEAMARPLQAASTSAITFAGGAAIPVLAALVPGALGIVLIVVTSLVALAVLGIVGATIGAAPRGPASMRVLVWGALAMAATAGVGSLVGLSGI